MARGKKTTLEYFPFYVQTGKKMFIIEKMHGNDGFTVYVKILRELAKTENHFLNLSDCNQSMFLSAECNIEESVLKEIINTIVKVGKFDAELWENHNVIWCQDFIDGIKYVYDKRTKDCFTKKDVKNRFRDVNGVSDTEKGVSDTEKGVSGDNRGICTGSKVKESKVKESIFIREADFKKSLHPFLEKFGSDILNDFYLYWSEKNPNGKKMKFEMQKTFDISRRLSKWKLNETKFKTNQNGKTEKRNELGKLTEKFRGENPNI